MSHGLAKYLDTVLTGGELLKAGLPLDDGTANELKNEPKPVIRIRPDWADPSWLEDIDSTNLRKQLKETGVCRVVTDRKSIKQTRGRFREEDIFSEFAVGTPYIVELGTAHRLIKRWPAIFELNPKQQEIEGHDPKVQIFKGDEAEESFSGENSENTENTEPKKFGKARGK